MNISSLNKAAKVYKAVSITGVQPATVVDTTKRTSSAAPTDTVEISAEARLRASAATNNLSCYSKSGDVDEKADALASKIGGVSSVIIPNFGNREFDAVSDKYVAQTNSSESVASRPQNFLDKDHRNQIKATFEAAKQENKDVIFEFTGSVPHQQVVNYIQKHAAQTEVKCTICDPTKPIL